ncbi:GNAT family N-acetyltransferase [Streptomyces sp. NBC_01497]|uniref:GNAT family N-acetyltransferase n=1 Tax=Streptomyces sp. NBC_01497 TaxID=2903885 RepID=UPI002E3542E8|nr:GNAT family N-acetyltransferase [Streptomyces sp. NBC_01497]
MDTETVNGTPPSGAVAGRTVSARGVGWVLCSATAADVEAIAELRAVVMRPDLERLGRYDEVRVRQRFRDSFSERHTSVVVVDGELAGCVTVRPTAKGRMLEHFYLAHRHQGRGLGTAVLRAVLARTDAEEAAVRLTVLQGSSARRLYERHGFVTESQDPVDVVMVRPPVGGTAARNRPPAER